MRRLALSLVLVLCCGAVAAEQVTSGPSKTAATTPAPQKPAAKAAAKKPAPPKQPPARVLFGAATAPAPLASRSIGSYAKGCLAGGVSLPINGPDWQVMRLSRNRNWGTPQLLDYLERLASDARALDGWPGLLVGDMSQPRGGPMLTGHTSHQVGLDADIWLTPMPDHIMTPQEREDMSAVSMLKDPFSVDPALFTDLQMKLIRRAASYPQVARIFVHPAIKKALCEHAKDIGKDTSWLGKVRPWWNHHYHFHVRLRCPPDWDSCENQKDVSGDDGCGQELTNWYAMLKKSAIATAQAPPTTKPWTGKPPLTMAQLPKECGTVLTAGGFTPPTIDSEPTPAALAAMATKDAGPPLPTLTPEQLKALTASKTDKTAAASADPAAMPLPDRNPVR
ncbi:MAG TPA: penicillin-insensitive murein endopeptidase [Methyloceanibacter sp.]|jgi:penicillin-insensitive murein DD-endopeptidase|nr:penicillin-insensitive murein endopeptidase [Methyloceanibacter sp.]